MPRSSRSSIHTSDALTSPWTSAPLLALPLRLPFLEECIDAFHRILGVHQLLKTDILRLGQAFVEVHGVPRIERLLCDGKGSRTELDQTLSAILNRRLKLRLRQRASAKSDLGCFRAANAASTENQVSGSLHSHQCRQSCARHPGIETQFDLGESPLRRGGRINELAHHPQLGSSAQAMTLHRRHCNLPHL